MPETETIPTEQQHLNDVIDFVENEGSTAEPEPSVVEDAPAAVPGLEPPAAPVIPTASVGVVTSPDVVAAPVAPVAPAAPVEAVPAVPLVATPAPSPVGEETHEQARVRFTTAKTAAIDEIAKNIVFTDEELTDLALAPEKVLPRLAARIQVEAFESTYAAVVSQVPALVQQALAQHQTTARHQAAFFGSWPQLQDPKLFPFVQKAATLFKQSNPTADEQTSIRSIGALALTMAGVPLSAPAGSVSTPAPPIPLPKPFVPASPGSGSQVVSDSIPNPFEKLIHEFELLETL